MPLFDPIALSLAFLALALGGLLKGATGMGAPLVAIPVLASLFDVRVAVALMVVPNLVSNLWQLWQHHTPPPDNLAWRVALGGALGAGAGTALLAHAPTRALSLLLAAAVLGYVALRLGLRARRLAPPLAGRLALPLGLLAGALQGAAGLSAPVAVGFLNAVGLSRAAFVPTISLFFIAVGLVQLPGLALLGLLDGRMLALGALALVPLAGFMPLGARLGRRIGPAAFDRLILAVLVALAVKLALWP